jgi:hypothetical protein
MSRTLLDLAKQMDRLPAKLANGANEAKKEIASAVVLDLAKVTPADTGEAISNWQVASGPSVALIGAHVPSRRGRMIRGVWTHSIDPEITRAANAPIAIEQANLVIKASAPGEPIFIVNTTPQIVQLDRGTSKQEPGGFVYRAIILGRTIIDRIRLLR